MRIKQFVEAEKDTKSAGNNKKSKRSSEKSESSSGGSGSSGANAVGRTAAGKEEQDDWKRVGKAGKSYADVVKKREKNSSRSNLKDSTQVVGGAPLSIWLISFHVFPRRELVIISLQGWPRRHRLSLEIGATLIALPTMKTSHPSQELSALTVCSRGVVRATESGDAAMGNSSFPMEADFCRVSRLLLMNQSR